MAAITPYLELKRSERGKIDAVEDVIIYEEDLADMGWTSGLAGLSAGGEERPARIARDVDGQPLDSLAKPHTELTRLLWARTLIANALVGAKFKLEFAAGVLYVNVIPPAAKGTIPWSFASNPLNRWALFSTNSKMAVPTWDLPAGMGTLGGACPGAAFAQSTVAELDTSGPVHGELIGGPKFQTQVKHLIDSVQQDWSHLPEAERGQPVVNLNTTVCSRCYASGGKYGEAVVQFSEVARYAMVRSMLAASGGEQVLIRLLVTTIESGLKWNKAETAHQGIRPIRIHSSGDFFSMQYARMWLQVARQLEANAAAAAAAGDTSYKPVVLWAPTRTHALAQWETFWRNENIPKNFIIRPSAYSVGDPAPFIKRNSPTGSKGTSVLFADDTQARLDVKKGTNPQTGQKFTKEAEYGDGTKFDFQCGVYALGKGEKTCTGSIAPDGTVGCRACWKRPDLAVNYVVH